MKHKKSYKKKQKSQPQSPDCEMAIGHILAVAEILQKYQSGLISGSEFYQWTYATIKKGILELIYFKMLERNGLSKNK